MEDINYSNEVIYDAFKRDHGTPCGLTATDVKTLENVRGKLLSAPESHLCDFISQIGAIIAPSCCEAQILPQVEVLVS